jgi:signal transduction histidine kinase
MSQNNHFNGTGALPAGMIVVDPDGRIVSWDATAARQIGPAEPLLRSGAAFADLERKLTGRDGLRLRRQAMADGGAIWLYEATAEEPAERDAAVIAASPVFAGNPMPMWLYAADDLRFLAVNDAAATLFGLDRERLGELRVSDINPVQSGLWQHHGSGRDPVDLSVTRTSLDLGGHRVILGVAQDVTAVRHLKASLEDARDQAERITRAKHRFFTVANHDLRQPLAALALFIGALESRLPDQSGQDILRAMGTAVVAVKNLVDAHLDIARINAGSIPVAPISHAVNGVMTRMALEFVPQARQKGLALHVEPCSAMIHTDRDLLERILRSLMSNAVRYTESGRILLGCRRRQDDLRIEVWDTGCGIPEDQLGIIFEEFYRGAPYSSHDGAGFGLGLAIVDRLARRLGHPIEVRSQPGRGSCFAVIVPVAPDHAELAPPTSPEPTESDFSRARVLVIDDDAIVLQALELLLGQWGCDILAAATLEEAVARVMERQVKPDLILADFRLPGTANGIVAIRQIAKLLDAEIPGLILTGDTDPRRLREAKLSGYPLLHKPVTALALRAAVAKLLGRDRLRQ